MNRQEALIKRALRGSGLGSYGALAKKMGVSAATMSQWRSYTSKLSDERVTQLSELAGDDPGVWLITMMAEECNIVPLRKSLHDIVAKVGKGMSMALAIGVASLPWAGGAKASDFKGFSDEVQARSVYYVLARLARATAARAQPALQAPPSNGRPNTGRTAPHRPSLSHPVSKRPRVGSAHHLRTGLAMRLADFIEQNAREILDDAVAFAETQAPDTVEFSAKQLRNHLPQILQAVIDDLRSPQTDSQQLAKSHGLAPLKPGPESAASYHGRTRAIAGFGLNQMVAEYRALRASVLRRWASDQRLVTSSIDDILRFNEAIDQAVAESLAQFSAEVESWRQIFLAALGHDLRGPLAAIIFSADTLASGLRDPALAKQAERIINGSMRMKKLLDDLLAYSRSKLGDGMAIHPVDCDLAQSLGEEVELLRAALPHVPITYEVEGDARGCFDAS